MTQIISSSPGVSTPGAKSKEVVPESLLNTSVGVESSVGKGERNTSVGTQVGRSLTTGQRNTLVGAQAGISLTTGSFNTFVGDNAGRSSTGANYNVAVGDDALLKTTGSNNTAVGTSALQLTTTGEHSVGMGVNAGRFITTSNWNVVIGTYAAEGIEEPPSSEEGKSIGSHNVVVGAQAVREPSTTVEQAVVLGYAAGQKIKGNGNTIVGYEAAENVAAGNTIVGASSATKATGSHNTVIGYNACSTVTTGNGNVIIGYEAGPVAEGALNNALYIDNEKTATPLIQGSFSANELKFNTEKIGFNGVVPVTKATAVTAVPTTKPGLTLFGYTEAQAEAIIKSINEIRTVLKNLGLTE